MSEPATLPLISRSWLTVAVASLAMAAACVGCRGGAGAGGGATASESGAPSSLAAHPSAAPNALPFPTASVEAAINPLKLPRYDGPTGSIEGTVFVKGPDAPDIPSVDVKNCPAALDTYAKLFRAGPANAEGLRPLADAVVVVTGYAGYFVPDNSATQRVTITANCAYPRRSIVMTYGQRLEIANDSRIPFAPYIDGTLEPAVMIAPPRQAGDPVKLYPPRPAHYLLADRLQAFAIEDLYVLRHPLHAVTDLDGHYRIDGVPTTKVKVGALLNVLRNEVQKDVDVRPNVVEKVDLVLTYAPSDAGAAPMGRPPNFIP